MFYFPSMSYCILQIQNRVRSVSLTDKSSKEEDYMGGNVPISISTLTNYRKLYMFPAFPILRD